MELQTVYKLTFGIQTLNGKIIPNLREVDQQQL